jgi:hypothetical protein
LKWNQDDDNEEVDNEEVDNEAEEESYALPRRPWQLSRQSKETIVFCLVVGLIAGAVWGIYKWTNAARFTPTVYSHGQ